jgi:hypothetical protein
VQDTKLIETILGIQMPGAFSRVALDTTGERDVRKQEHRGFQRAGTKHLWLFSDRPSCRILRHAAGVEPQSRTGLGDQRSAPHAVDLPARGGHGFFSQALIRGQHFCLW